MTGIVGPAGLAVLRHRRAVRRKVLEGFYKHPLTENQQIALLGRAFNELIAEFQLLPQPTHEDLNEAELRALVLKHLEVLEAGL